VSESLRCHPLTYALHTINDFQRSFSFTGRMSGASIDIRKRRLFTTRMSRAGFDKVFLDNTSGKEMRPKNRSPRGWS